MNINNHKKTAAERVLKPLFETQQQEEVEFVPDSFKNNQQVNKQKLQTVLAVKSKQFVFDCGAIMGSIKYDTQNMFSLRYHYDKSTDFESFLSSVKKFISASGESVTANDEARLKKEYQKMS
jgi:hypothetical protein